MNIIKELFSLPKTAGGYKRRYKLLNRLGIEKKDKVEVAKAMDGGQLGGGDNNLNNYIDSVYDYYCLCKIIGLVEVGEGNIPYSDLNIEMVDYTEDDLNSIKNLRSLILNFNSEGVNPLLYDNTIIEVNFSKYSQEVFINRIPNNDSINPILYIKCRKINKYAIGGPLPDAIINILPEYMSLIDLNNVMEEKKTPLIKITAEDYYKGQYFINESKILNQ